MGRNIKGVLVDVETCEVKTCTISCNKDTGLKGFEGILKANYLRASRRPIRLLDAKLSRLTNVSGFPHPRVFVL